MPAEAPAAERAGTTEAAAQVPSLTLADVGDRFARRADPPESTLGGETTCIVCMANPKTHLAAPCGHHCACDACADQMKHCPICRQAVVMWVKYHRA